QNGFGAVTRAAFEQRACIGMHHGLVPAQSPWRVAPDAIKRGGVLAGRTPESFLERANLDALEIGGADDVGLAQPGNEFLEMLPVTEVFIHARQQLETEGVARAVLLQLPQGCECALDLAVRELQLRL